MTIGTERRNDKVETKKPEIIQDCNKIMLGLEGGRTNFALLSMLQDNNEMG
jgi:hypothetical protein